MAATTARPWQRTILDTLGELQLADQVDPADTHAAVWIPANPDLPAELIATAAGELAAIVAAEDASTGRTDDGQTEVVRLDDLVKWSQGEAGVTHPHEEHHEEEHPGPAEPVSEPQSLKAPDEPQPGEQAAAFDPSAYDREDLQIPKVDGQSIDRISLKFTGEVFLDRSEPSDVAVYNAFRLGKDVELIIEAKCSSTAAKGATDRDGDLDVVVGTKGLKIHSLRKPAGADWVTNA